MMSMNLVFHLFSAILAFVLAWYLMRMRAQLKFTRELISGAGGTGIAGGVRVFVDSPYRFLKRFTAMIGASFDSDDKSEADITLVKIDGSALLRICLEYGVFSIRIEGTDQNQQLIRLSARSGKGNTKDAAEKVAAAFNGKVLAEFT